MSTIEPSAEIKAKIILDEANLTFCENAERKDQPGERTPDGSAWDSGKMDGEYDEEDYQKILDLQAQLLGQFLPVKPVKLFPIIFQFFLQRGEGQHHG